MRRRTQVGSSINERRTVVASERRTVKARKEHNIDEEEIWETDRARKVRIVLPEEEVSVGSDGEMLFRGENEGSDGGMLFGEGIDGEGKGNEELKR